MNVLLQKPYKYRSDIFSTGDSSEDESKSLPSRTWRTEEEEEEHNVLQIAKSVVGKPKQKHNYEQPSDNKHKAKSKKVAT